MKKEITKSITETVTICDICNEPAQYSCAVCSKDICGIHTTVVTGYTSTVYICRQCKEKPVSEIWNKLYMYLNTIVITYPTYPIYPIIQYRYQYRDVNKTGDYWAIPTYTTSSAVYNRT